MGNNLFLYQDAQGFGTGEQSNVCIANDAVILCEANGRCVPSGCYTAPETVCTPFSKLVASWNSDTPEGTSVEVQVRVRAQGAWSAWLSYGKWSPFLSTRGSTVSDAQHPNVTLDTDTVCVAGPGADAFQLRVFLYASQEGAGPSVCLLAAALDYLRPACERGEPLNRSVPVPAYAQSIRDPRMASVMCSPTTIAMLMNRFGEDVLPEEAALACYDNTYGGFGNWSFTTALAGCYGYECYVRFADIAALKQEIKHGFGCGVSVRYTNCTVTATEQHLPFLEHSTGTTKGHLLVVRGFETADDGTEYVLVNDSYAGCDNAAQRRYLLEQFEAAWNGMAYILHAKCHRHTLCPPYRVAATLPRAELPGEYALTVCGERRSLPVNFLDIDGVCTGCVCYALHESHAYATTAHKCFFYGGISENGNVALDAGVGNGLRFTAFIIGNAGITYAAELTL